MTLADYIAAHLQKPFAWGSNDCTTFVIGWLESETGIDYLSQYRPWSSAIDASRILKRLGGLEHMFDKHLTRINQNMAADGHIALIDGVASLFSGPHVVAVGEHGLQFKNRTEAKCAWRY